MIRPLSCAVVSVALFAAAAQGGERSGQDCISVLDYDANGTVVGRRLIDCADKSTAAPRRDHRAAVRGQAADAGAGQRPPAVAGGDVEPGELLVANPPRGFLRTARRDGYRLLEGARLAGLDMAIYRLATPAKKSLPHAEAELQRRYPGLLIGANQRYETAARVRPNDSWARDAIGWPPTDDRCGRGIRVGMIDAAVDLSHPALKGRDIDYRSFHSTGRKPGPAVHGTAIAALIAGQPAERGWGGLLPNVQIKAANMFEVTDQGKVVGNAMGLFKAMNWMLAEQVHVLNLSIAGSDNRVARAVFNKAHTAGLVMVAAAGNWGRADRPAFPAAYPHVLAVTAVGTRNAIYDFANRGGYIDFAAPGVRLWTAVPGGGRYQSGTSFAAPYVSVLTAVEVFRGANPSANDIRRILRQSVLDLGAPGHDDVFGWGLINKIPRCDG